MENIKQRVVRGGAVKVCAQGTTFLLRLGSLMVLARLLDPGDFGLVGMVTAFTGVLGLFRDFGLSAATVQRVEVGEDQISTLFWINIAVGSTLMLIASALAPLAAKFYHQPRILWVMVVMGVGFLFNAAGVQHSALLQRQMRFTTLAMVDVVSLVVSITAGIVMAWKGLGYWALVATSLIPSFVYSIGVWIAAAWIPGMPRRNRGVGSLMRFGGTVTLNSLVVYFAYNLEKILLGRVWGADAVGIYGRAYQLISIPTDNLNSSVGEVAFSALSRLQTDQQRLRSYFLKGYALTLGMTLPLTIICALFANDAIFVVLGPKWNGAAVIFRLLSPTIVILAMINPFSWFLWSTGRVGRSLKIALVIAPLVVTGYVLGLPYGPKGVALGYSTAMTIWVVPHILWCVHGTVLSARDIFRAILRPFLSGTVAGLVTFVLQLFYGAAMSPLPRLALGLAIFNSIYVWLLLWVMGQRSFYQDLIAGLRGQSPPVRPDLVAV
jgi:O-antigen/teichoic acid export membrane protein